MRRSIADRLGFRSCREGSVARQGMGLVIRPGVSVVLAAVSAQARAQTLTTLLSFSGMSGSTPGKYSQGSVQSRHKMNACHRTSEISWLASLSAAAALIIVLCPLPTCASDWALSPGQTGDWSVASNWDGGLPTSQYSALIMNGGTATVTQPGATCNTLYLGSGAGSGEVDINAGSLSAPLEYVGSLCPGTISQISGTNSILDDLYLGTNTGVSGDYNLGGNARTFCRV